MTEQRYGALSTLKAIGIGLLPLVVLVVLGFYNPSDFGTKAARASLGASTIEEADGGKVDRRGYLAAALEDFDRFSAFVDAEATNTAAYEAARWQAMKRETIEAAELLAPHLTIDYSWDDELGKALTELKAGPLFSAMAGVVFPVPETRELRLKLTNMDEEKLGKLKEEYVRFRVFPFASGTWVRWCLLTREERKAAAMGPLWDLAIWLATSLGLGGLFYFFMVRHWCEKCWKDHWLWTCPNEDKSDNRDCLKTVLAMGAVFVVLMAVSGWWLVGWGNVRTLAKMVHDDDGESAEILCAASPVLMHHYQLELLEEIEKAGRALPIVGGAEPDVESDFIRILTLNDIFKKSRADEDGQTDEDEQ